MFAAPLHLEKLKEKDTKASLPAEVYTNTVTHTYIWSCAPRLPPTPPKWFGKPPPSLLLCCGVGFGGVDSVLVRLGLLVVVKLL